MSLLQRFAGSVVAWTHQVSASTFGTVTSTDYVDGFTGVGSNETDVYTQTWTFVPGAFLYREGKHAVRASTVVAVTTEYTNNDFTTRQYQPELNNIPIRLTDTIAIAAWGAGEGGTAAGALARDPTLAGAAEYRTQAVVGGQLILPTSPYALSNGLYLGTNLNAALRQQVKLLGSASDYLGNITLTLSGGWTHQFWNSTVPINTNLNRPRQDSRGAPIESDILRGGANVENRFNAGLSFFLPLYGDLQLNGSLGVSWDVPFSQKGNDCDVQLATGCVDLDEARSYLRQTTNFDVSLYYQVIDELGVDIGYNNNNNILHDNGKFRNPIFSPSSLWYADVIVFPQTIIAKLTAPPKPKNQTGSR